MSKAIYYFSGTGNSLYVAKKTAENMEADSVISIADMATGNNFKCDSDFIGIVTPIYVLGLPKIVSQFLKKTEFKKESYIFLIITAGNPAVTTAAGEAKSILKKKGVSLSFSTALQMPDNAILFFNPVQQSIEEKAVFDKKLFEISLSIKEKEKSLKNEFRPLVFLPSLFRFFVNKLDRFFKVDSSCTNCGLCQKICPVKNITIENNKPAWNRKCEMCFGCINVCPSKSINYTKITKSKNRYINQNVDLKELLK